MVYRNEKSWRQRENEKWLVITNCMGFFEKKTERRYTGEGKPKYEFFKWYCVLNGKWELCWAFFPNNKINIIFGNKVFVVTHGVRE